MKRNRGLMMNFKFYLVWFSLFLLTGMLLADSKKSNQLVDEAWAAWEKNDQAAVEATLLEALKADETNTRAYLALAFLFDLQEKNDKAWDMFQKVIANEPNPYPYVFGIWSFSNDLHVQTKANPKVEAFWNKMANSDDPVGSIRAMAHQFLGGYYERRGDLKKSREHYAQLNAIVDWKIIGPFDNTSASGYGKISPPETEFDPEKAYDGKSGVPAKWFEITRVRPDRWIDFERYFAYRNAIFYGNNFVYSPAKQMVQIRIGTSGSLKAFLNDVQILEYFDENNNDLDTYMVETELQQGWNRLLVKIGQSEIDRSNFMVRITDAAGNPVEGLKVSVEKQDYPKKPDTPIKKIENFAETFFQKKMKANPDHLENYLMLSGSYLRNDKAVEGELILKAALKRSPNCALFHFQLIEAYSRGEKYDEIATNWEKMANLDANIPAVLNYKFQRHLENEQYDQASAALDKLENITGATPASLENRLLIHVKKEQYDKVIEIVEKGAKTFPDNWQFAKLKARLSVESTRTYTEAIEIYKDHLKKNYSTTQLITLASAYLKDGNVQKWEEQYAKVFELDPSAVGLHYQQAKSYISLQEYDKAEAAIQKAINICPNSSSYWAELGAVQRANNKAERSKSAYQEALLYSPANYDAREVLRELEGKPSIFSYFKNEDVNDLIKNSPDGAAYPDDDALILYKDHKRVVYERGATELSEEILIKLFNNRGVDNFKEYWIEYNGYNQSMTIEKAVTIKADGSEIKADINENHIVFKSMEANDHLYVKWRIKNYYSGKLSNHFWDEFNFNSYYPIKDIRYSLLAPKDFKFNHNAQNMEVEPSVKQTDEGSLYQWQLTDEPAIVYEYGMPTLQDIGKILHISSIDDWAFMVNWYTDIAQTKARSSYEIQEQVKALFADKPDATKAEKIQTIYNFITENIRYSSVSFRQSGLVPQEARDVLVNKIGDCKDVSTLCIAMLREVGINAHYVLVNTRDEGYMEHVLPSISFNHCIAGVETDAGIQYLDLTANNYPYGALPRMDQGGFSLLVKPGVKKPAYLAKEQFMENSLHRKLKLTIDEDGAGHFEKESKRSGNLAASFRATYRDQPPATQEKMLQETLSSDYTDVKLKRFTITNPDAVNEPAHYTYAYTVPGLVSEIGSFKIITLPWTDAATNSEALSYEERKYPYYYWPRADTLAEDVTIHLPPGYEPMELGSNVNLECSIASYQLTISHQNGVITARREMVNKKDVVLPEDYEAFKKFYNSVVKEDKRQILLKAVEQNP